MSIPELPIDVLIFGGGIAGLWTLARLRQAGYSCVLLESNQLGSGQTIASQGIIHGGVKYALTGSATSASKAIAEMPAIWQSCLSGAGEIDLRSVEVLSRRQYLWTTTGIGSRLAALAASKAIRTPVYSVPSAERPQSLASAPRGVDVYAVDEMVLDPRSLVQTLAGATEAPLVYVNDRVHHSAEEPFIAQDSGGARVYVEMAGFRGVLLRPKRCVMLAGAGNNEFTFHDESLAPKLEAASFHQQRRPLHMVMARGDLPPLYGHCIGFSDKPRITITSQTDARGRTVWYIGGEVAESGVDRSRADQIAAAKAEVAACLPWIDLASTEWATLAVSRAEGVMGNSKNQRPDEPFVLAADDCIFGYPTKLAFAPLLATRILNELQGLTPTQPDLSILADAERPTVADLPWERQIPWT